jgi:hypothetical protein
MHDNFCAIPALSGLPILPGASAEGALDVDPRALLDIVPKDLAYPLVTDEVVPFGSFLPFPAAIFETVAGSVPSSRSQWSAPCAESCAGTCPRRSSSVGLTNSSPTSSGVETGEEFRL